MKEIDFRDNINTIREIYDGCYRVILDFATSEIVKYILTDDYKYVWVHNHLVGDYNEWNDCELPVLSFQNNLKVKAKGVRFDFILETEEFKQLLPDWNGGIEIVQMNKYPPNYLDIYKIKGKTRFELLKNECDYLFELSIPTSADYGEIISSDLEFLQSVLCNSEINWDNLP